MITPVIFDTMPAPVSSFERAGNRAQEIMNIKRKTIQALYDGLTAKTKKRLDSAVRGFI